MQQVVNCGQQHSAYMTYFHTNQTTSHRSIAELLNVNIAITEPLKIASQSRLRISFMPSNRSRRSGCSRPRLSQPY